MDRLSLSELNVPRQADAPLMPPEIYAQWVWQNIERLRDSGQLDRLCSARFPVNVRFTFPEPDISRS